MALEIISQILSPANATYINGVSAERRVAPATLKNMFQGLVYKKVVALMINSLAKMMQIHQHKSL